MEGVYLIYDRVNTIQPLRHSGRGLRAGFQMGLRIRLWFTITQAHYGYLG